VLFELTTHRASAHEQALHLRGEVIEAIRLRTRSVARRASVDIFEQVAADFRGVHSVVAA
jgi:hypothetical protein